MAKPLINKYPKLRGKMGFHGIGTEELADLLEISKDSVRRRLRGDIEFELPQVIKLMKYFNCSFEDLFGEPEEEPRAVI